MEDLPKILEFLNFYIRNESIRLAEGEYFRIYTLIYRYISANRREHGGLLYTGFQTMIEVYLDELVDAGNSINQIMILELYSKLWTKYSLMSNILHHVFRYMNRHWLPSQRTEDNKPLREIQTVCLHKWKVILLLGLKETLVSSILKEFEKHRESQPIQTSHVQCFLQSLLTVDDEKESGALGLYKETFQVHFLEATETFYKVKSSAFIASNSVLDYMTYVKRTLHEEENRAQLLLNATTRDPLAALLDRVLISDYIDHMCDTFTNMLDQSKLEELGMIYTLLGRINGHGRIRPLFESYIRNYGLRAVERMIENAADPGDSTNAPNEIETKSSGRPSAKSAAPKTPVVNVKAADYVASLMQVHWLFVEVVDVAFGSDVKFRQTLDMAFKHIVNRNKVCASSASKSPELIAKYCDEMLKKGTKLGAGDEDRIEGGLTDGLVLFDYVEDKDVFQKFYSQALARRLVNGTSVGDDSEALMIGRLKERCGVEYTGKLQRMVADMNTSKELMNEYKTTVVAHNNADNLVDMSVMVLSTAHWPLNAPKSKVNMPTELVPSLQKFQGFYTVKHSGRKLIWLYHISKVDIKMNHVKQNNKVSYQITVTTFQAAVILLFNEVDNLTFTELVEMSGLDGDALSGALQGLVKNKILLESSDGSMKKYEINFDFKSKKIKHNLTQIAKSEQREEANKTHKTIQDDRKILTQAAIVRVMKSRKTMKHQALLTEVLTLLASRFKAQPKDIKKCIDILLEKEYFERIEGSRDEYSYVA